MSEKGKRRRAGHKIAREEYLTYLETITPKVGDATKELRDKTRSIKLEAVLREAKRQYKP